MTNNQNLIKKIKNYYYFPMNSPKNYHFISFSFKYPLFKYIKINLEYKKYCILIMLKINKALVQLILFFKGDIMKFIIMLFAILAFTTGCTKKEFKTNWHNVQEGTAKRWDEGKKNFQKSTKEYEENKKKDSNKTVETK